MKQIIVRNFSANDLVSDPTQAARLGQGSNSLLVNHAGLGGV